MAEKSRRDALVLLAVMGGVSALTAAARLVPHERVAGAEIDLDQIFPERFDGWRVDEATRAFVRPALDQGKVYGIYDQVLERTFINDEGQRVMLSVVYGSEQSKAMEVHRPELCYRANGYQVQDFRETRPMLAGRSVPVVDLQAEMPGRLEPVTYWIVVGGEPVAGPRSSRWRLLSFSVRKLVPDALLVRVSSINIDPKDAAELHRRFADGMLRAMSPEHRAQVIGKESPG